MLRGFLNMKITKYRSTEPKVPPMVGTLGTHIKNRTDETNATLLKDLKQFDSLNNK